MSELNGHRSGAPVEGDPDPNRPVTFTWQRQSAAAAEEASLAETGPPSQGQPAASAESSRSASQTGTQPPGPPAGGQPGQAIGPSPRRPGPGQQAPTGPSTGAQRSVTGQPPPGGWPSGAQRVPPQYAPAQRSAQQAIDASDAGGSGMTARRSRRVNELVPPPPNSGPESDFAVPPPGGRLSHGRGAHLAVRVGIAFTCCLLLLGFTFIVGLFAGRVGSDPNDGVSSGQLGNYHVDTFPLQAAAAVAQRYTRLCLNAQPTDADQRSSELQSIVSGSVPSDCGWDGRGTLAATDIAWTGEADPMTQYGAHGRYLHMQVALGEKAKPVQLIVPVYVADLRAGTGVRIAGEPGILPNDAGPSKADAVTEKGGSSDAGLAQMLTADVLPGFFDAWGSSSSPDIDRYRTTDASENVRRGLSNILTDPEIQATNVPLPGSGIGNTHTWQTGDAATVETTVTWQVPGGSHLTLGYRLTMVRTSTTATGWSVRDVAGGLPDSDVDSTAGDNIPSELPSTDAPTEAPTATQAPTSARSSWHVGSPRHSSQPTGSHKSKSHRS